MSLVFYDHDRLVQLAITGEASLHFDDSVADEQWSATPVSSRRAYLAPLVPGTIAEQPEANLPPNFVGRLPDEVELRPARPNFAVIAVAIESIDWLRLSRSSNLRARFAYEGDDIAMEWIAP